MIKLLRASKYAPKVSLSLEANTPFAPRVSTIYAIPRANQSGVGRAIRGIDLVCFSAGLRNEDIVLDEADELIVGYRE